MTTSRIHNFNFVKWIGPAPVIVQEQGVTFHRPGVDGVGQQTIGRWEDAFSVQLVHWETTYARALRNLALMKQIVRTEPLRVIYEGIDYRRPPFRHLYWLDDVRGIDDQKVARQIGQGINYQNGGQLIVEFTMTPHALY